MIEINLVFGTAIYGIVWFVTLFIVLPFGVVTQDESGAVVPGSTESAPAQPRILRKLLITTVLATVFFIGIYYVLTSGALSNVQLPFMPEAPAAS
jgi:predicted secreted protein